MAARVDIPIVGHDKTGPAVKSAVGNLSALKAAASSLVATMAPLAGAAALTGFAAMVKGQVDAADKIQKLSLQLGVSTEALSQYQHVAKITGTSFETMTKGLRYMQKNLSDAQDGLSTAKRAFSDLGLAVDSLASMSPERAFEAIGQALSEIPDAAKRTQLAMNVFGRAGAELIQTFSEGAAGVAALREEADRLGITLSQESANKAAEANDAITRLKTSVDGLKMAMLELTPAITFVVDGLTAIIEFEKSLPELLEKIDPGEGFLKTWAKVAAQNSQIGRTAGLIKAVAEGVEELTTDRSAQIAYPTVFMGYAEAALAAGEGVYVFGSEAAAAEEKIAPLVTAIGDANAALKDYSSALSYIADYEASGMFDVFEVDEINTYVAALNEVGDEGSRSMTIMADAAYDASRRMADAIGAAVFESKSLLEGLGNVAKSVFSSILGSFISIGVNSLFPVPGIGGAAGSLVPGGDFIGPVQKAMPDGGKSLPGSVSIGELKVSVAGTISNDRLSVRKFAEDLYTELQTVAKHHG